MAIAVDSEGGRSRERNGEGQAGSQAGGDGEPANPSPAGRPLAFAWRAASVEFLPLRPRVLMTQAASPGSAVIRPPPLLPGWFPPVAAIGFGGC